jgi:DNA polymerase I
MIEAYRRELRLMPHILKMEQRGINLDGVRLALDTDHYWEVLDELDQKICEKVKREVDVDSNAQLADAIEAAGLSKGFATTPTGLRSTSKESLIGAVADPELLGHLLVRGSIATCLRTFMQPWRVQFEQHGRLYMKWNQIRNYSDTGARTGRISSSPNLQNIPVEWEELKTQLAAIQYPVPLDLLPQVRKYIIPDIGKIFIGRDYSAQEMKLLAHFTNGALLKALQDDPSKDVHLIAAGIAGITRKVAKTLGFAVLYGAGVGRVAETLGVTVSEATRIKERYLEALPEIKAFQKELSVIGKSRSYTETLGGRHYYAQKPAVIKGSFKSFEYKMPNYKIQGSAADQTKEAMIRYAETTACGELVLTVHDQLVTQVPEDLASINTERTLFEAAVNGSFQEVLRYKVTSDESIAYNFAELKGTSEAIADFIGRT